MASGMDLPRASEAELKEAFNLFDMDQSGKIDAGELAYALKSLGYSKVTQADIDFIMRDVGGEDQLIDYLEFSSRLRANTPRKGDTMAAGSEAEIKKAFKVFDKEGSGAISYENLAHVAEAVDGSANERLLRAVMLSVDRDGDGVIGYEDFHYAVTKYEK